MIRYKIDIIEALKNKGYTTTRIRKEKILSEGTLTNIRNGGAINTTTLNVICEILKKQPGQVLEWVPDTKPEPDPVELQEIKPAANQE